MREPDRHAHFEQVALPYLGAAYRFARWLTRNDHDAEDVVQEAYLRACKAFGRFRGTDVRAWLLTVVRNTCYTWLQKNRGRLPTTSLDEHLGVPGPEAMSPERLFWQKANSELLHEVLQDLPMVYREVIVLRELEGCSYKEIAAIAGVPLGTVMSRLMRARDRLRQALAPRLGEEVRDGM